MTIQVLPELLIYAGYEYLIKMTFLEQLQEGNKVHKCL